VTSVESGTLQPVCVSASAPLLPSETGALTGRTRRARGDRAARCLWRQREVVDGSNRRIALTG
jgi:hypothetical protein